MQESLNSESYDREAFWHDIKEKWPGKFRDLERFIFQEIRPGNRIFVGTGCGEPQHLVRSLLEFVKERPKAFLDAELINIVTLGVAPYTDEKFQSNFRLNSFFIGDHTRNAVNRGEADYTPIFLSNLPQLIRSERIPLDVALIQTTLPDKDGRLNLGVSVDIVRTAVEKAGIVIAQPNSHMPAINGDGWIRMDDVDYLIPWDEPLLEYIEDVPGEIAQRIGKYVARIVEDGSTIQVGYGSIPNAIVSSLKKKKHLGVHSELLSDGIAGLIRDGVVDNSNKSINPGKTIATFCMGHRSTYDFLRNNDSIEFRTIDYTNNPLIIAQNSKMIAINSALEIDLTGQATAESLGHSFYSGIGGQADFMRGTAIAPGGKTVLALPSTALVTCADSSDDEASQKGGRVSRIVPFLGEGAGVTLTRGDIHYVVTEYGIAYLHGKSIRERAMALIAIAHPLFRLWLIEEAKRMHLIYPDQAFIPGVQGEYPEELEAWKTTRTGLGILLRPVKISDEPLLKDFFYSLSDESMYQRFISARRDIPHQELQKFAAVDYFQKMVLVATVEEDGIESICGLGQYGINSDMFTADVALVVRDDCQNHGIGGELLAYLTYLAKRQGLLGFTAEVLAGNDPVFHLFKKMGFAVSKRRDSGVYELVAMFP
ncbi:MAG TPA: GNAT family N-acetyltransferase [Methanothrix soehngenii]|jgi:acyl-CoA hydrolase/GNAT superfamily N-acetyltransferase|uniref:Acetyl-CoA hydrolase/transferase n=1 Tax=Methanothrix soehngenii (strain ATCC 5969 / DSM 3671 / JCM 10134 / NBRC 103675 / OCM 69 / GP-6) TaxID=990316 RepID=F4BTZ0_METSG|nr:MULTISPECIES: GNAT family N-acetyltransferase [Methanothrix]AEB67023.1 acetyl-CoA hydrolase/transferase [Methanothrix soehngenii GP6]HOI21582.1 GNAT family N-acetyltransferase [Methanothrix soehngenii]